MQKYKTQYTIIRTTTTTTTIIIRNHRALVVQTENAQMGWHWFRGARAGLLYGTWRCLAQLQIPIWKLLLTRQVLQPNWQHLTRRSSMLDCHHRWIRLDCGEVPRPDQQGCSSVLKRVGQLALGGDDRGCSSIFVFVPTDFVVVRFNSVLLHDGFVDNDRPQ